MYYESETEENTKHRGSECMGLDGVTAHPGTQLQ